MPGPVSDIGNQFFARAFRPSQESVDGFDDDLDQIDVLPLVEASDVVGFSDLAPVEDRVDGPRMILDIEPVADVLAFSIYRQGFPAADIVDEQRDQLLRKLVGP